MINQADDSLQVEPSPPLLNKTIWAAVASLSAVGGRFIAGIVTARLLGPYGAGRLAYLLWLVDITVTVAGLGLTSTITRFFADLQGQGRKSLAANLSRWIFVRYFALTVLGGGSVAVIGHLSTSNEATASTWAVLVFYFCFQSLSTVMLAELAGRQRFDLSARINIISSAFLVIGVSVGTSVFGLTGTVAGYLAGVALPGILSFAMLRVGDGRETLPVELRQRVVRLAGYQWLNAIVSAFVWSRIEVFFLNRYWDSRMVAMFTIGSGLAVLAGQGPSMLIAPLMPHFAELVGGNDLDRVKRTYSMTTCLTALMLFPLALGLAAITPTLLPMLYGEAFRDAVPNAVVLVAFSSVNIVNVSTAMLLGLERARFLFWVNLPFALLSVISGITVMSRFGAQGAAWSRAILQTGIVFVVVWYVRYRVKFKTPFGQLSRIMACAFVSAVAAFLIVHFMWTPISIVAAICGGAVVYFCAVRFLRPLRPEDVSYLQQAMQRLPARYVGPASGLARWFLVGNEH